MQIAGSQRTLISAETFRKMARKGAKPADFENFAVLKHGTILRKDGAPKPGNRQIPFVLSNAAIDREGDSIAVTGWTLENYKANPVVLWAHDHGGLPVGKALNTYIDGSNLCAMDEFADAELYPFADTVYRMLDGGFLNACSVGFQPEKWEMSETGVNFESQDLLEHSVCPVPAHPQALVIARSKGIDTRPLRQWAERTLDMFRAKGDAAATVRKQLERLRAQSDPSGRNVFAALCDVRFPDPEEHVLILDTDKGVVPSNISTSLASEDATWSAPTLADFGYDNWADLTDEQKTKIAEHYAWAKEMPPATFADLSLPHHDPKTGSVVWAACVAVAARIDQADIPSADLPKVKAHMRAHYEAFGKDVPDSLKDAPEDAVAAGVAPATAADAPPSAAPSGDQAPPDTPADDENEATQYATMASMLAQAGTACGTVNDALTALMATPEPGADDPAADADEDAQDATNLDAVASGCRAAAEALTTIAEMAEALLNAEPAEPPADAPPADGTAPAADDQPAAAAALLVGPKRWNPRLSKTFDIGREQLAPADVEEALVAKYMDVDLKLVERRRVSVPAFRMGSWLTALDDELASEGWLVDDVRNLNYEGLETSPVYETIELNSSLKNDFLVDGIRFMKRMQDSKEERFALDVSPNWYGLDLTFYGIRAVGTAGKEVGAIATKAKAINFLKGEAFALCGEFLPKTGEVLDDLFLGQKNAEAITRTVALINGKRGQLENRGLLMIGPPGTGKTLSARILRNVTDSTFIWISSRDFHYAGAFGGITEAFDLARECASGPDAPASIVVFEDIDNWLSDYTLDLLKTELDGVGRSSGVVTLMTTNYPEHLPQALLDRPGRFHDVLRFGLPDDGVRKAMLKRWIADLDEPTLIKAVDATKGYSGAHLRELARFASIISEQESLSVSASVERALVKLAEQREVINQAQTAGSRYRMPKSMIAARKERPASVKKGAKPNLPAREVPGAVLRVSTDDAANVRDLLSVCASLAQADLTPVQRVSVKRASTELLGVQLGIVKEGRVLSSKNEDRIRKATDLLNEVLAQLATAPTTDDEGNQTPQQTPAPPKPPKSLGDEQVLELDDEPAVETRAAAAEQLDIDAETVRDIVARTVGAELTKVTGRVDFD